MNRRRGTIWLAAGLILAVLAAVISYFAFQQITAEQANAVEEKTTQTVVVSRQLINERAVIRLADITTEEREVEEVPSGAIFKTEDVVGSIATRSIQPGQVILAQNLVESFPVGGSSAIETSETVTTTVNFNEALGEDLVAYALPATDRFSAEGIFLPGDRVDVLVSTDVIGEEEGTGGPVSMYVIQDLEILQVIYQAPPKVEGEGSEGKDNPENAEVEPAARVPKTILLAIEPQDAVVLKYAIDTETSIDLALRGQDNRRRFEVDTVTINTIAESYDFEAPRPVP
ncbi:MAG: Flp pilus assembly protein CpaB [Anaerolineae bacterium]|nr:Flp pilus assembly protein CpaB [Anaerolineae bacterium]